MGARSEALGLEFWRRTDGRLRVWDLGAGEWLNSLSESEDARIAERAARRQAEARADA